MFCYAAPGADRYASQFLLVSTGDGDLEVQAEGYRRDDFINIGIVGRVHERVSMATKWSVQLI